MNKTNKPNTDSTPTSPEEEEVLDNRHSESEQPEVSEEGVVAGCGHCESDESKVDEEEKVSGSEQSESKKCKLDIRKTTVILSAPIRTDAFLDLGKLLNITYKEASKAVHQKLSQSNIYAGWLRDEPADKKSPGLIGPNKAGRTYIPPYFLGYYIGSENMDCKIEFSRLKDKIMLALNEKTGCQNKEKWFFSSDSISISKVKIKFYQFGFASISVYVEISNSCKYITKGDNIKIVKSAIESDKFKEILQDFFEDYCDIYINAAKKYYDKKEKKNKDFKNLVPLKKSYWTHRIIAFGTASDEISDSNCNDECNNKQNKNGKSKINKLHNIARAFLTHPTSKWYSEEITEHNLILNGQIFVPGTGNSILYYNYNESEYSEGLINICDMIEIAGTHSAFMHNYHSQLLYAVDRVIAISEEERSKFILVFKPNGKFQRQFAEILQMFYTYSRIDDIFKEYEYWYLSSINKGEYEKIKDVWRTDELQSSNYKKIELLEKIYDKNDNYIDRNSQLLINILLIFVGFSALILGLGKIELFKLKGYEQLISRLLWLLCVVAILYLTYRIGKKLCKVICKYLKKKCFTKCNCCEQYCSCDRSSNGSSSCFSMECNSCGQNCNCVRNCE